MMNIKNNKSDKLYGTAIIGSKGQVVIPVNARKDLKLKPGDRLVVLGKMGMALGLIKVDQMQKFVNFLVKNISKFKIDKLDR